MSLTITPILSYLLLPSSKAVHHEKDGIVLSLLKWIVAYIIRFSLAFPRTNIAVVTVLVLIAGVVVLRFERDFLPPFNEGAVQLNVLLRAGNIFVNQRRD